MPEMSEVATTAELMQLVERSQILRPDELEVARRLADETHGCKMLARRFVAKGLLTRWQAGQLLVGWHKLRLGRYRLCRQLGRGKLGRVFLAEHMQLERQVAIKTLSRRFTQRQTIVDNFLTEARDVAALDHRNILHLYDIDSDDGQYFLVVEYVRGCDLQRMVEDRGPLPFGMVADYVHQAASGLAYAHQLGMLHRDVRPTNLMVDDNDVVKILGLGVGRLTEPSGMVTGKPAEDKATGAFDYVAPESLEPDGNVDIRSDIYSLGCTAYYLMTGQPPYAAGNDRQRCQMRLKGPPTDICDLRVDAPRELVAVIDKMMARRPQERHESAGQVAEALDDWLQRTESQPPLSSGQVAPGDPGGFLWTPEEPVTRAVAPPGDRARDSEPGELEETEPKSLAHRKWLVGLVGVLLVMIAVVIALAWPKNRDNTPASSTPSSRAERSAAHMPPPRKHPDRTSRQRRSGGPSSDQHSTMPLPGEGAADESSGKTGGSPKSEENTGKKKTAPKEPPAPAKKKTNEAPSGSAAKPDKNDKKTNKTPATKSTPKPPPSNPLGKLPPVVDLVPLASDDDQPAAAREMDLGPLTLPPAGALSLRLLGAEHAAYGGGRFELVPLITEGPNAWQFQWIGGTRDAAHGPTIVAQLVAANGQLTFRWEPSAKADSGAEYLRNCVLRLTAGPNTHDIRLRRSIKATPLLVNFKRRPQAAKTALSAPPDPKQLRLEVTSVGEPLPAAFTLEPAEPVIAKDGVILIKFGQKLADQVFQLEIRPMIKPSGLWVNWSPFFQIVSGQDVRKTPLTKQNISRVEPLVMQQQQAAFQKAQAVREVARRDRKNKRAQASLKIAEAALEKVSAITQKFTDLKELQAAIVEANGAAVHFRLFYLADDCEVELLHTSGEE